MTSFWRISEYDFWSVGWSLGPFVYIVTYNASHAGIIEPFVDLFCERIFADSGF